MAAPITINTHLSMMQFTIKLKLKHIYQTGTKMQEIINAYGLTASESLMLILQEQEAPDASRETCEVCDLNGEGDRKTHQQKPCKKIIYLDLSPTLHGNKDRYIQLKILEIN